MSSTVDRRTFIGTAAGTAAGLSAGLPAAALSRDQSRSDRRTSAAFKLAYAPHFGMFRQSAGGDDPERELRFMAEQGFTALEDNGMAGRSVEQQELIARVMGELNMRMGVFVVNMSTAWAPTLSTGKQDASDKFLDECRAAVDVAKRVNATWMTVVPGTLDGRLEMDYQNANVIDALRRGAEIFEPHGLVMVLEPLNHRRDHPGMFLSRTSQAHMICRAVNSPACKILFDAYHQQITEGNLIPNIDLAWSEIAYVQVGDNPGRCEPGTGEINHRNVFRHLHSKGFAGIVGMEHGNSKGGVEGERAVVEAYRQADAF